MTNPKHSFFSKYQLKRKFKKLQKTLNLPRILRKQLNKDWQLLTTQEQLEQQIISCLSEQNKFLLQQQLLQQQADYQQKQNELYRKFIFQSLYAFNQSDYYQTDTIILHNSVLNIPLNKQFSLNNEVVESYLSPRIVGKSAIKKQKIEKELHVNFVFEKNSETGFYNLKITADNGYYLQQANQFFRQLITGGYASKDLAALDQLISEVKINFVNKTIAHGKKILMEFLEYTEDIINDKLALFVGSTAYSFTEQQNLLQHLMGVARIASSMASQLNLNPLLAKRCGFFHDIGKISIMGYSGKRQIKDGQKICEEFNLGPEIYQVISQHHQRKPVPNPSNYYLLIVKAADVLSAARPGARKHNSEYFKTVNDLIKTRLKKINFIRNITVHNLCESITIRADYQARNDLIGFKKLICDALYYDNLKDFKKIFEITINFTSNKRQELKPDLHYFEYDNLHKIA